MLSSLGVSRPFLLLLDGFFSYRPISVVVFAKTFIFFSFFCVSKVIDSTFNWPTVLKYGLPLPLPCDTSSPEQCNCPSDLLHTENNLLGKLLVLYRGSSIF